jgi:predicted oxidoreductase
MTELVLSNHPVPLGKSGMNVSPLSWGMWRFRGADVDAARRRVEAALDAGMTLLDTADIYGPDNDERFGAAEALLGKVLKEAPGLRSRMTLATKGGIVMGVPYDSSPAYLAKAVEASLTRMGVDHIDLYQIHRPDHLAHPADVAETLTRLKEAGKIGAVGTSNHTVAQTLALQAYLPFPIASIQIELSPLAIAPLYDGTVDHALETGLAVLAWSPLAQGRLGDGAESSDPKTIAVRAALETLAKREGVPLSAVAYAWLMAHPARPIPIIGTQTEARIAEANRALEVRLTRADWYAVLTAARGERLP